MNQGSSEAPDGIVVVHNPQDAAIDIVVVHGIGARPDRSWSYKAKDGSRLNWLNHDTMLPKQFPDARVLAFGYKSAWFGHDISRNSLTGLASMLRNNLEIERKNCPRRPLIFCAHCFGGLITIAALTETPEDLFNNTIGIIFLGTPFHGANDKFPKIVKFIQNTPGFYILKDILEYLKKDNIEVKEAIRRLKKLKDRSPNNLPRIHCVNETQESDITSLLGSPFFVPKIKMMVVDEHSAYLGVGDLHPFQRDHFQLNKFRGPEDAHFKQLCNMLLNIRLSYLNGIRRMTNSSQISEPSQELAVPQETVSLEIVEAEIGCDEVQQVDELEGSNEGSQNDGLHTSNWRESSLPEFVHRGMIPEKFTMEIQHRPGLVLLSHEYREWRKRRFDAVAAGLSLDCKYVFLRHKSIIRIFSVNDFKNYDGTKEYPSGFQYNLVSAPGKTEEIRFVCLGTTICAFTTSRKCFLWDFANPNNKEPKTIKSLEENNLLEYKCIAISETEGADRTILLAIGMENTQSSDDEGMVRLLKIPPGYLADSNRARHRTKQIDTFVLKDEKTDYPKTLSFSRDGSLLVCTTGHRNQVHAWQLKPEGSELKAVLICRTTRPFKSGVGAKGITSAISWLTTKQHPYVICTTVPSSERKNSKGGEWTFMSPLTSPLPSVDSLLYHCFLQIQGLGTKHLKIHAAAISPQGNIIALLDSNGKICLIPIQRQDEGGLHSDDDIPPIEVGNGLDIGDNEQLRGDIRFNKDGTKLFAVTGKAGVEVYFPNEKPVQPRTTLRRPEPPPRLPPLLFENSSLSSSEVTVRY